MADTTLAEPSRDPVAEVMKWLLLAVAVICFGLLGLATVRTYREAPPLPAAIVDPAGATLMAQADIVAGKNGFQKADLMDYGSIYGMGSYFGEDYTAATLKQLGVDTRQAIAQARYGRPFEQLAPEQQFVATDQMRRELQGLDLTRPALAVSPAVALAIRQGQARIATALRTVKLSAGWTPARSLSPDLAVKTADFILYSALTTVARRPGTTGSWTENWPFEPLVGNAPTLNTFHWTWISFTFTFFAMGTVLFLYRAWLDHPDDAPIERGLAQFYPLTPSQRCAGKYFLVVALVFLVSQGAGAIMAHSYYDRQTFYGISSTISCHSTFYAASTPRRRSSGSVWAGSPAAFSSLRRSPADARLAARECWSRRCSGSRWWLSPRPWPATISASRA